MAERKTNKNIKQISNNIPDVDNLQERVLFLERRMIDIVNILNRLCQILELEDDDKEL